jgi:hypothetical protein
MSDQLLGAIFAEQCHFLADAEKLIKATITPHVTQVNLFCLV